MGKYHVILCREFLLNTLKEIQEEKREKETQRDRHKEYREKNSESTIDQFAMLYCNVCSETQNLQFHSTLAIN